MDHGFEYLTDLKKYKNLRCRARKYEDFLDLQLIQEALQVNVSWKVARVLKKERKLKSKVSTKDFVNSVQAEDIVSMSNTHMRYITFVHFKD